MKSLLDKLGLQAVNQGTCVGPNSWLDTEGAVFTSFNPTTGESIAAIVQTTPEAYEQVITHAQAAFLSWREMPAPKRGLMIRDFGVALRERIEPLGELVSLEMGKIRAEGIGEVQEAVDICDFAVGLSRQLYGLTMHSERPFHRMYEQWHPLGLVGVITAFNFPAAVWAWNSAIAAVCGDMTIWKPSEVSSLVAVAVQHIANRVMADYGVSGVFNLVTGAGDVGKLMTEDARLPLISFTGSIPTGRKVAQTVAGRLGRSLLELGGNNAIIVEGDADLDLVVRGVLFGAVGTAGQRCTSTRRLIMHRDIAEELTERLVKAYQQVPIGDPLVEGILMGPLVTETAVSHMQSALTQAQQEGGQILAGGKTRPDLGPQFV
jgi:aldehyde dehydrogenase (NAD+)